MSSDHFAPWSSRQGQSGFAWSWLGAALTATTLPFGVVTAPGQRYHPAIIAQAVASLLEMYPGRLWVALGTGEASNEHITGDRWPDKATRTARLSRVRGGHAGPVRRRGGHPPRARRGRPGPPVDAAAHPARAASAPPSRSQTARWVGGWADGLITVNQDRPVLRALLDAFRAGGGDGKPAYLQAHVSWAPTEEEALAIAHDQWRSNVFAPPVCWDLELPEHFDEAARFVRPDDVRRTVLVSADPSWHRDRLAELVALGFDGVWIHHVGQQQQPFLDVFGEHVVPDLRRCA